MKHLAGTAPDGLWFGVEVEGFAIGEPTAFVACELLAAELAVLAARVGTFRQVYFTETFDAWGWFEEVLLPLVGGCAVTVARVGSTEAIEQVLALPYAKRLHIVARVVEAPWVHLLRPHDEVSIGTDYHLRTWEVCDGVPTLPEAYARDSR